MSLNHKRRRKLERAVRYSKGAPMPLPELRASLRSLVVKHVIELAPHSPWTLEQALAEDADPDIPVPWIVNTPERTLELCKADPNIYKTPCGNMVYIEDDKYGNTHWLSPTEAEAWKIDAAELDRLHPGGTQA